MPGKIEKKNQITVDQHYVSRFNMKNFSTIKGTGKKEKAIKQFVIFQYCRTLAMYNYSKDTMAEILLAGIHNWIPDVSIKYYVYKFI